MKNLVIALRCVCRGDGSSRKDWGERRQFKFRYCNPTTVILLFIWIIASFNRSTWSLTMISRRTWLFLVLSGIATGLSWLCYFHALQLGEALRTANRPYA